MKNTVSFFLNSSRKLLIVHEKNRLQKQIAWMRKVVSCRVLSLRRIPPLCRLNTVLRFWIVSTVCLHFDRFSPRPTCLFISLARFCRGQSYRARRGHLGRNCWGQLALEPRLQPGRQRSKMADAPLVGSSWTHALLPGHFGSKQCT